MYVGGNPIVYNDPTGHQYKSNQFEWSKVEKLSNNILGTPKVVEDGTGTDRYIFKKQPRIEQVMKVEDDGLKEFTKEAYMKKGKYYK